MMNHNSYNTCTLPIHIVLYVSVLVFAAAPDIFPPTASKPSHAPVLEDSAPTATHSYQKPATFSTFSPGNTYRRPQAAETSSSSAQITEPYNANNHNSSPILSNGPTVPASDPNFVDIKLRTIGLSGTLDSNNSSTSTTSGSYVVDPHELCHDIDEMFFNTKNAPPSAGPLRC